MWDLPWIMEGLIFVALVGGAMYFTKRKTGRWPWERK